MNGSKSRSHSGRGSAEFVCLVSAIEEDGAIRCIYEFPDSVPVGRPRDRPEGFSAPRSQAKERPCPARGRRGSL
jgi:hypothetical protein